MRRGLIALAVVLLAVAGWLLLEDFAIRRGVESSAGQPEPASPAASASSAVASADASTSPINSELRTPSSRRSISSRATGEGNQYLHLPVGEFDQIRPELERRALAGDELAAFRLAKIYQKCVGEERRRPVHRLPRGLSELLDEHDEETHQRIASADRICSDLGKVEVPNHDQLYWYWLELAADQGSVTAMIEYSGNVIPTWPAVMGRKRFGGNWPSALGDAEMIIRYREKAIGYLQRAVDLGFPYALMATATEYTDWGNLYPPDPVRAFANTLAFKAAVTTDYGEKQAVFHLSKLVEQLTDTQITDAEQLAEEILRDFYDGHNE